MAAPTASLFGTESVRIQEIINKNVDFMLPTLDPVWRDTLVSSQGVGPAGQLGRDMKILRVIMGSFAGVLEQAGPRDDFVLYGDPQNTNVGSKIFTQGVQNTFPDPLDGAPNARPYRLGVPMRAMVSNLPMTLGELQAEATPAFIGEVIAPKMMGFARMMSHTLCNYIYLSQNSSYTLAILGSTDITVDTNVTGKFSPTNYAVERFAVGMRISFYDTTVATLRTTASGKSVFLVTAVDELKNVVYFKATDGLTLAGSGIVDTDIAVYANSRGSAAYPNSATAFTGIAGLNSWLKPGDTNGATYSADNTLLGAERDDANQINVNVHPEFKSLTYAAGSVPMTEHLLRKLLRRFHAAKGRYGQTIDCLIAADGVWLAYEATKIGRERIDRTNRRSNLDYEGSDDGRDEGMTFVFDGRTYKGYTSNYVDSGVVYGIKKGENNWKRYVPPSPRGTSKFDRADDFVPFEFVAGALTGTSSNQIPIFAISNGKNLVTEAVQMPGMLRLQLVPDQPAGMKITGLAEDRLYSDN